MIDYLVDLVSKTGILLLNIPQRPDGTLEAESEKILAGMEQCLDVIGEAVFNTRVWTSSGEGPATLTDLAAGTARDVRFTRNKANNVLYATVLDWPGDGATSTIQNLNSNIAPPGANCVPLDCGSAGCWGDESRCRGASVRDPPGVGESFPCGDGATGVGRFG